MSIAICQRPTTGMLSSTDHQQDVIIPTIANKASLQHGGSLLFQFENMEDARAQPSMCTIDLAAHAASIRESINFYSSPNSTMASRLLNDVLSFKRALQREEDEVDTVVIASKLSSIGYCLSVRTALGASGSASCFQNLRHEFLLVRGTGDFLGMEYVVDMSFKEQFAIPHPTDTYTAILKSVPEVYVGPVSRIIPIVQALCVEMARSFSNKGLTLPPWRKTQSILSKWVPANARDINVGLSCSRETTPRKTPSTDSDGGPAASSDVAGSSPTSVLMSVQNGDCSSVPLSPSSPVMRISFTRKSHDAVHTVGFEVGSAQAEAH